MAKGLEWTPKQTEVAELLRGGADRQAIMAKGFSKTMVSRVANAIKTESKQPGTAPKKEAEASPGSTLGESKIRTRTLDSVVVGEFIIEPADWRLNQYGGFLVLNTYEHARQKWGYTGTVGDFICDACQIMRLIMGLDMVSTEYLIKPKEDDNGRGEASQGTNVPANAGEKDDGGGEPGS